MLRLGVFGGLRLERDGAILETRRRGAAILAILAAAGDRGVSRAKLVALLWPDSDDERARNVLAQTLHKLKREVAAEDLVSGTTELRLNPVVVTSDLADAERAIAAGRLDEAVACYRGPFLDGFYLDLAGEFERWVAEVRAEWARRIADLLETLAHRDGEAGDWAGAVARWRQLATLDPLSSRITLALMRALANQGDPGGAIRAAMVHTELLSQELSAPPDPAIPSLVDDLRRRPPAAAAAPVDPAVGFTPTAVPLEPESAPPSAPFPGRRSVWRLLVGGAVTAAVLGLGWRLARPRSPTPPPPVATAETWSLAVLPFADLSGGDDHRYVADGLTEEITTALARVPGLRVVARNSAFAFRGREGDLGGLAAALRVQAVLDGSVRQSGDRMRITARLINLADGRHLWAASFDRGAANLLAVQDEIAKTIADTLRRRAPTIGPAVVLSGTEDVVAHDLYLRGRYAWNRRGRDDLGEAVGLFRQAVERDPRYAAAYSGLADALLGLARLGVEGGDLEPAERAAGRAIALDPRLSEAHVSRAAVLIARGEAAEAEEEYRRAIELDPNYPTARHWFALLLESRNRGSEALVQLRRAAATDPLSPAINSALGGFLLFNRDYPGAVAQLRAALALDSAFTPAALNLAEALGCSGRVEEAFAVLRSIGPAHADEPAVVAGFAATLGLAGFADSAQRLVRRLEPNAAADRSGFLIGAVYAVTAEPDSAFRWLDRADWGMDGLLDVAADPLLDPIRGDPRYRRLLAAKGAVAVDVPAGAARCGRPAA